MVDTLLLESNAFCVRVQIPLTLLIWIKYMETLNDYDFKKIVLDSKSYYSILKKINMGMGSWNYNYIKKRIKKLDLSTDHFIHNYRNSKFDFSNLKNLVLTSSSYSEVLKKIGMKLSGGNFYTIKEKIKENKIDVSHFNKYINLIKSKKNIKRISLEFILIENSTYTNNERLKIRLIKEGYFEHKCYSCNLKEWMGKLIPIQIEHINGIHNDNRIENLNFLCPNCHALTDTYCGKNKERSKK